MTFITWNISADVEDKVWQLPDRATYDVLTAIQAFHFILIALTNHKILHETIINKII